MRRFARLAGLASLAISTLDGSASAQSLQVSPVLLEIPPSRRGAVLQIQNVAAVPVDIQVRPYDWRQNDGRDELIDSTTLLISPSIATIPAGATQTVRLLVPAGARTTESNWRILVDQLPKPVTGGGLQVRLRMSIPVFAYAAKATEPDVRWRLAGSRLEASNIGPRYARLGELNLRRSGGKDVALPLGEMPYLLPGSSRHWDVAVQPANDLSVVGLVGTTAFTAPIARELAH